MASRALRLSPLLILAAVFVVLTIHSLSWRLDLDGPLLLYVPMMWDRYGLVPYRDVFEFNAPGGYVINWLALKAFGASDMGMRLADLSYLAALSGTTALAMRPCGRRTAWGAALLFGVL